MTVINASYACQTTLYRQFWGHTLGLEPNPHVTLYSVTHADAYMDALETVLGYEEAGYSVRKSLADEWICWNDDTGERLLVRVIATGGAG